MASRRWVPGSHRPTSRRASSACQGSSGGSCATHTRLGCLLLQAAVGRGRRWGRPHQAQLVLAAELAGPVEGPDLPRLALGHSCVLHRLPRLGCSQPGSAAVQGSHGWKPRAQARAGRPASWGPGELLGLHILCATADQLQQLLLQASCSTEHGKCLGPSPTCAARNHAAGTAPRALLRCRLQRQRPRAAEGPQPGLPGGCQAPAGLQSRL